MGGINAVRMDVRSGAFFAEFTPSAHRGASRHYPENTIESFRCAQDIMPGCLLETDARQTADGAIILMHDDQLQVTTDGMGPVNKHQLAAIRDLEAGYNITFDGGMSYPFRGRGCRIPLFSEILDAFPDARFSVDIKDNSFDAAKRVIGILRDSNAVNRVIVGSFHERIMRMIHRECSDIITSFSKIETLLFLLSRRFLRGSFGLRKGDAMLIPEFIGGGMYEYAGAGKTRGFRIITPRLIQDAHSLGIPVLAWTINKRENMSRLIDWGIDGIVTDRIDVLKEVMKEKTVS